MNEFNQFTWNNDDYQNNTGNYLTPASEFKKTETVKKKKKAPKAWMIAFASAVAGALIVSFVSPVVSSYIEQSRTEANGSFQLENNKGTSPEVKKMTYSDGEKKELTTVEIGKIAGPSVVGITTVIETQAFNFFGQGGTQESSGSGSGIIITADGYILTNNHVINGAKSIKVILNNSKEYDAKVIGSDVKTDIAVLKIEEKDLNAATLGDSDLLEAGEKVVAIGNPLGQELAGSLTQGIISALNRTLTVDDVTYKLIQTDAAINPGNSGGPLVNVYGEVIGINTVKVSASDVEGLGFSIPINDAKPIIEDLINFGYVKGRPLIGLSVRYITQQEADYYGIACAGLYVVDVSNYSGAEKAGIKKGDVIIKCEGQEVKASEDLNNIRDKHKAGDTITLTVNRDGTVTDVKVELTEDKPTFKQ